MWREKNVKEFSRIAPKKTLGRFWFATSFSTAMLFLDLEIHVGVVLAVGSLIASMHFLQHIGRYLHWQQISENESENETEPMRVYHSNVLEEAQRRLERDRYRG